MKKLFVLAAIFSTTVSLANAFEFKCVVTMVSDGDTITCQEPNNGAFLKIRMADIDAPEKKQSYGPSAKTFAEKMLLKKEITVECISADTYGRFIGTVIVDDKIYNEEIVRAGLAWWYQAFSTNTVIQDLEKETRTKKIGLWSHKDSIPPWEWRKAH